MEQRIIMKLFTKLMNYFVSDKTIQLTKLEILNETVEYYSADPKRRSYNTVDGCTFNGKDGTHCAVGRCLLPEYQEQGFYLEGNSQIFAKFAESRGKEFDDVLQEQYRGHEMKFWERLQHLHDTHDNWDKSGITFEGELAVNEFYEIYDLK
jgi:hypothetical protein